VSLYEIKRNFPRPHPLLLTHVHHEQIVVKDVDDAIAGQVAPSLHCLPELRDKDVNIVLIERSIAVDVSSD